MKRAMFLLAIGLPVLLASQGWAQEEGERPRRDGAMREEMIKEFDADGDGKLSDDERQTAREAMRERRGDRPEGRRRQGQGRGPGGEGRPAPPDPNLLFDEFDADKDGQLSRDEFMKLTEVQRERRGPRPPREGRPDGPPRGEGDDRPGPPPGDRDFGPRPPLQNQIDGPPGPPPEGEFGPPRGPRGPEARGPRPGGPEGRGPDPNQMFDRFDANGDDQLSRDEFMQMTDRLREMRERFGQGGPGGRGPRGGEGFGGPRRGGPAGGRPPRPQRPDGETGAESEATEADENSA
ncbi:MAG: EF-hand domain-containing protein [Bythopirellula sp.]|nr:EF-hand domain-containing protein [Bythopirellula sp.]